MKRILRNWHGLYFFCRQMRMDFRRRRYGLRSVERSCYLGAGCTIHPTLVAGPYSLINDNCFIGPSVSIGAYTMLARNVAIVGGDHKFEIPGMPTYFSGRDDVLPTKVGRDVWIGHGSIIIAGVAIGDGAVIAAGSVVTKDVDPCVVQGGVPAKKIRDRFKTISEQELHLEKIRNQPAEAFLPEKRLQLLV